MITNYARPKPVDAPLTLTFRTWQGACRCCFCAYKLPISLEWMSATNQKINYSRGNAQNHWPSVDAHSRNGVVTVLCLIWLHMLPIHRLCITATKSLFNYHTYRTTYHWRSIDAHFNLLFIQHLLPSIIVFIIIWTHRLRFWQMETRRCGKAERSIILALLALKLQNFIYLAKRFIAPAIHLFINRYSQATAHHSPIIYF